MKQSKDGKCLFDESDHTYKLGDKILQSVTGLIGKYKIPFDSEKIATAYALKHDLKKEDVLTEWEKKKQLSCSNGTFVHKLFETFIQTGNFEDTFSYPKEGQAVEFIKDYFVTGKLIPVETELIVYNEKLATQIDCIAKNKKGEHFIFDWKTNERISMFSYKDQRMLQPFHKYMDCNFYHYSLQIELCKKLCKEYKINRGFIVHLDQDNYNIIEAEKIIIPDHILN